VTIGFDTNILIYSAHADEGEKHRQAVALIARAVIAGRCILTLQALGEFYHATTRKLRFPPETAYGYVSRWQAAVPVQQASPEDLAAAHAAVTGHGLSFWDALIWATSRRAGVSLLLSEDFQHGRTLDGVTFANPFQPETAALIDREIGV